MWERVRATCTVDSRVRIETKLIISNLAPTVLDVPCQAQLTHPLACSLSFPRKTALLLSSSILESSSNHVTTGNLRSFIEWKSDCCCVECDPVIFPNFLFSSKLDGKLKMFGNCVIYDTRDEFLRWECCHRAASRERESCREWKIEFSLALENQYLKDLLRC